MLLAVKTTPAGMNSFYMFLMILVIVFIIRWIMKKWKWIK